MDDEETSQLANMITATAESVKTQIGIFRHKDKKQQALQKALSGKDSLSPMF